jgi:hypothetical protein
MAHRPKNSLELRNWVIGKVFNNPADITQSEFRRLTTVIERCKERYAQSDNTDKILGSTCNLLLWVERNLNSQGKTYSVSTLVNYVDEFHHAFSK